MDRYLVLSLDAMIEDKVDYGWANKKIDTWTFFYEVVNIISEKP